jgi:outer membrane protein assembly factor BamB
MNAAALLRRRLHECAFALAAFVYLQFPTLAADWPQFRGPTRDGISTDRLNRQWTGAVTNPVWRIGLTNCLGSLAVQGGRVFTQTLRNIAGTNMEVIVALNATNGVELWATPVDIGDYPEGGVGYDDGPRSTPVLDGDSVFVLTSYLKLYRLNVTNGAIIWQRDLVTLFGAIVIAWQNAASPVIENGLIYLNASCGVQSLMALRVSDGGVEWRTQDEYMTHTTPTLATIHGVRQIIFNTQSGVVSLNPQTGELLWRAPYPFNYGTSVSVSPVVYEDLLFMTGAHSYGMGSFVLQASVSNSIWSTTRLWFTNNPAAHWMTPVVRDGFLYGQFGIQTFDSANAQLKCVEMRTGAVKWSVNGFGRGATILWDNHLVSLTERGDLVLVKPLTNAYTELARFNAIPGYHDYTNKCWNGPAVSHGRIYVRSTSFVACFDLSIPSLKFDAPRFGGPNAIDLAVRTVTGVPVSSNRFTNLEVRASASLSLAPTQWTKLTNTLVLTGGVVRVPNVAAGTNSPRFFIVNEQP